MPDKHLPAYLLVGVLLGAGCLPVCVADDLTPRPQQVFSEKPRIEDYADYNTFLVDIMEYRRQKQERMAKRPAGPQAGPADDTTLANVTGQSAAATDLGLYRIDRPESLEEALNRASKLPHPVYDEPERFGRTTAASFPMPPMEGEDMAARDIAGKLQDMNTVNPEAYEDPTALDHASAFLAEDPNNDDEVRDKKAAEGTNEAYPISYDVAARVATDSDGHVVRAPLYIKDEVGYTAVYSLNIEITTLKN